MVLTTASLTLALGAAEAQAVITEPIPADVGPPPPPIPALPSAGGTAPPAEAISDPITPSAGCGSWYQQTSYGDRWPTGFTWWEYRCGFQDPHCTGYCDQNTTPDVWVDFFYWDGSQPVFYGEFFGAYYWSSYWGFEESEYWWDAPTGLWYQLAPLPVVPTITLIDSGPAMASTTNDNTPTFAFSSSEPVASFECRLDSSQESDFHPCTSPHTTDLLPDGAHRVDVRAIDLGGNPDPTPASRSFTVDIVPPDTQIDSGPAGPTNDHISTFAFSSEEGASFECRLDGGDFSACSSPFATSPLIDGPHSFEVRASDAAANTDPNPAIRTFTVNTVAPDTQIDSGPSPRDESCQFCWSSILTANPTPTFTFSSSEEGETFECQLDGSGFSPCSSPFTTGTLTDGPHSFEVKATDVASNTDPSPASRNFTVDTVAPDIWIKSGPPALTNDSSPTFDIGSSEPVSIFKCRMDGGITFSTECSWSFTTPPLPDGPHSLDVWGADAAGNGNANPPISVFTVDTVGPNTWIDTGPSDLTENTSPTFYFSSEQGSTYECQLDGAGFSPCSSPFTASQLTNGPHSFEVRATDAAGNPDPSPASRTFLVLPPPIRGETVNVEPVRGIVRIRERRAGRFRRLRVPEQIAIGSLIDAGRGRVALTSATRGGTQSADFYSGGFRVTQPASGKPTTELELIHVPGRGQRRRKHRGDGDALWGNGHGSYTTKGKYGSATVRGTIWLTEDLPEGTLFKVERGVVQVRDFTRDLTLQLNPGQQYLAPAIAGPLPGEP